MQLMEKGAYIFAQLYQPFPQCPHRITTAGLRQSALPATGVNRQQREALRHVVVQLARKARALLFLRIDQPSVQHVCSLFRLLTLDIRAAQRYEDEDQLDGTKRGCRDNVPSVLL
jgi:hypothetical protein